MYGDKTTAKQRITSQAKTKALEVKATMKSQKDNVKKAHTRIKKAGVDFNKV